MLNAICVKQLSFKYNNNDYYSLSDISLNIKANKCTGIIGPNGAGKSTFISALCGLLPSFNGDIYYQDNESYSLVESVKQKVALVPQEYAFYPQLTVLQNLQYFLSLCLKVKGENKHSRGALLSQIMEQCVLTEVINTKANKLSGGYKRRLNIAIALVKQPEVLFLDEPTVGIDPESRAIIITLLQQFKLEGKTLLFTSHMLDEVEKICDDIILLRDGKATFMEQSEQSHILLSIKFDKPPVEAIILEQYEQLDLFSYQLTLYSKEQLNECLMQLSEINTPINYMNYSANSVEQLYKQGLK